MPAVASILINPKIPNARVNFGSFPVIDIALERILTELYQGIRSYNNFVDNQIPSRNNKAEDVLIYYLNNCTGAAYIPENILLNSKIVPWNNEIFIDNKNITNEELNQYYIDFCNKSGLKVNYRNMSLSPNIYAIETFIYNLPLNLEKSKSFKYSSRSLKKSWFNNIKLFHQMSKNILINQDEIAFETLNQLIKIFSSNTRHNGVFEGNLMRSDWNILYLMSDSNIIFNLMGLILHSDDGNETTDIIPDIDPLKRNLRIIQTLRQYMVKHRYSNDELKIIFKAYTNEEITDELLQNINNGFYCFKTKFCDEYRKLYNDKKYQEMLSLFFETSKLG